MGGRRRRRFTAAPSKKPRTIIRITDDERMRARCWLSCPRHASLSVSILLGGLARRLTRDTARHDSSDAVVGPRGYHSVLSPTPVIAGRSSGVISFGAWPRSSSAARYFFGGEGGLHVRSNQRFSNLFGTAIPQNGWKKKAITSRPSPSV